VPLLHDAGRLVKSQIEYQQVIAQVCTAAKARLPESNQDLVCVDCVHDVVDSALYLGFEFPQNDGVQVEAVHSVVEDSVLDGSIF